MMRRILLTVVSAAVVTVATAPPAAAHTVSGVDSTNFLTVLDDVSPVVDDVTVEVIELGSRIQLTNTSDEDVVVLGYNGEPYLRVGPDGAFQNRHSPATYLNASREGGTVPGTADPEAEPDWERTGSGPTVRWHDHRAHWMGERDPPQVRADPDRRHVIHERWEIDMTHGATPLVASGRLLWVPGPSPWPWLVAAAVLLALTVALALGGRWGPTLAALVALLVVSDVAHVIGVARGTPGSVAEQLGRMVAGSIYSVVAWVAGIIGVRLLLQSKEGGLLAAAGAGFIVMLFGGVVDLSDLWKSQVPFAWDANVVRAAVTIALGAGSGLVVGSALRLRRIAAAQAEAEPATADAA